MGIYGGQHLEDKKIILLKHHPMNVKFTNTWYTSQVDGNLSDYIVVEVTSRVMRDKRFMANHPTFNKDISPFFVGPVTTSDGLIAHIFEHMWQASKVFPCHVDSDGNIKKEYWEWRKEWFDKEKVTDKSASRRPHSLLGYKDSDCLFSVHYNDGAYERLSYVDARKKIYVPLYAKYVVETESYKWLKKLYDEGKKIAIVDFDGYNYYSSKGKEKPYRSYLRRCEKNGIAPTKTLEDFLKISTIQEVMDCSFTSAGQGFIIKMLLEGDIEVKDGQIIDHAGALETKGGEIKPLLLSKEKSYEINY